MIPSEYIFLRAISFKEKIMKKLLIIMLLISAVAYAEEIPVTDYILGPGDLLEIKVFELPDLNVTVRVSADGNITLPLVGIVRASGLTAFGLERELKTRLDEKYLKNAQVSVFIKEYKSQRVSLMGAVKDPRDYELSGRTTLLQIISMAGGITNQAGKYIYVFRTSPDGASDRLEILIEDLLYKGEQRYNIPLKAGDVVNIPIDREIIVYVFGEVLKPGAIKFKSSERITILSAIATAGGFTDRASRRNVLIKRKDNQGNETEMEINISRIISGKEEDIGLEPEDVVIIRESFF